MKELLKVQQKIVPDLLHELKNRYRILQQINLTQPIGRRGLAHNLKTTERILRAEVDFLKVQGLIYTETVGMSLTDEGRQILNSLDEMMRELEGFKEWEELLAKALQIPEVFIIPGDSEKDPLVKREMGYLAARLIQENLEEGVLAVTGGSTIAEIADVMPKTKTDYLLEVLPARGGVGEDVEVQANMIAAKLASKLGGTYRMLHVPDDLSEEAYHFLLEEAHIQEYLNQICKTRMLIHGIGQAIAMAKRRSANEESLSLLKSKKAMGEALGYYFDEQGKIVHTMNSIGLRLDDLEHVKTIIAVAGGMEKAEAVLAVAQGCRQDILITDEACAGGMLNLLKS